MNVKEFNQTLLALWKEYPDNVNNLQPLVYGELKRNAALFVGLNPSFSERGLNSTLKDTEFNSFDVHDFFKFPGDGQFDVDKAIKLDHVSREKYAYFKKFIAISEHLGTEWDHVDLFFVRETSQSAFKEKIFDKGSTLNTFAKKQIELCKALIESQQPSIILVANALASNIFIQQFDPVFDDHLGCHFVLINDKNVPVFFSSMLTGQRALDTESYKRLKWHMKTVFETNNKRK